MAVTGRRPRGRIHAAGDVIVWCDQTATNLIVTLLEPQSQWGLAPLPEFVDMLAVGSEYPIKRIVRVPATKVGTSTGLRFPPHLAHTCESFGGGNGPEPGLGGFFHAQSATRPPREAIHLPYWWNDELPSGSRR